MANDNESLEIKKKSQEVADEELSNVAGGRVRLCRNGHAKNSENRKGLCDD